MIPSVSLIYGGPSVSITLTTRALAEAGLEVHVATTDNDGLGHLPVPHNQPIEENGVTYRYFRCQTSFYKFSLSLTRWLALHVVDYDLLHIHALFSYTSIPAAIFARRQGVPYIIRPLGTLNRWGMRNRRRWLKMLSFRMIEKYLLQHASLVHYTSQQEQIEATELGVKAPGVIIPLGIAVGASRRIASKAWLQMHAPHFADRTIILFMSRLDPKKGLDLLLPAFAELKAIRSNLALVIAGQGATDFVAALQQLAQKLGIANDIYWAGYVEGNSKQGAFAAADLFALPSYSENFGLAVAEALASGLPVVISDQVGIHREVTEWRAGAVAACSVASLTDKLALIIENTSLRAEMSTNALELARQCFSMDSMTISLSKAYASIARKPALVTT